MPSTEEVSRSVSARYTCMMPPSPPLPSPLSPEPECKAPANAVAVSTTNDGLNLEGIQCKDQTALQPTATDDSNDWGYECVEEDDDVWTWKPTSGYRTEHVQPCCLPIPMSVSLVRWEKGVGEGPGLGGLLAPPPSPHVHFFSL